VDFFGEDITGPFLIPILPAIALDLNCSPLAAMSALPEPGPIMPGFHFSQGLYSTVGIPHHQLFGSVLVLCVETNYAAFRVFSSRNICVHPLLSFGLFSPKKAKPLSQRPVSETVNFSHTSLIVLSHLSRSLCSTFPFLTEDACQSLRSGCSISSVFFFGYTLGQYVYVRGGEGGWLFRFHCHRGIREPLCWQLTAFILETNAK